MTETKTATMTDVKTTHGALSWFEHRSTDVEAAMAFYQNALDFETMPMTMADGSVYHCIKVNDECVGGFASGEGNWLGYVTVDDVDARAEAVTQAGGKIINPPFSAPGVGRMATIQDPFGATMALIAYESGNNE